jgi:FMN-dependent NADH-azoreductase
VTEEGGYEGLVTGRPVVCVYARGGEYPPDSAGHDIDMQKPYVELILGFLGFEDFTSVLVEPTLMDGPDVAHARREQAIEDARRLAIEF